MAITFAILAQGSAFWHGSETNNGGAADVRINDLFAYVAYQGAMRNVLPLDNSIIHDLTLYFRPRPATRNVIIFRLHDTKQIRQVFQRCLEHYYP